MHFLIIFWHNAFLAPRAIFFIQLPSSFLEIQAFPLFLLSLSLSFSFLSNLVPPPLPPPHISTIFSIIIFLTTWHLRNCWLNRKKMIEDIYFQINAKLCRISMCGRLLVFCQVFVYLCVSVCLFVRFSIKYKICDLFVIGDFICWLLKNFKEKAERKRDRDREEEWQRDKERVRERERERER